jgi:O-antigen ligase
MNGGWIIAKENLLFGIGTANYRNLSEALLQGVPYTLPQPHPHNYYIQILCENGLIGLFLGCLFIGSIICKSFLEGFKRRANMFAAISWVIPLGIFWPIATSSDFYGQWNNIFIWSAIALSLSIHNINSAK